MTRTEAMPRTAHDRLPGETPPPTPRPCGSDAVQEPFPAFRRTLQPATFRPWSEGAMWEVYVFVRWDGAKLALDGVEGPKANGDAHGSAGQIRPDDTYQPSRGWTAETIARLWAIWDAYHLNDMRAGCATQREHWNLDAPLEIVTYKLTGEAHRMREAAIKRAALAAARNEPATLDDTERALVLLEDWFRDRFTPPDADDALSGCFEVKKRETKRAGWVRPSEHSRGLLGKPCGRCGYRYGHAWLSEPVPAPILTELQSFPEAATLPPSRWWSR
jgi:hypothetical protein